MTYTYPGAGASPADRDGQGQAGTGGVTGGEDASPVQLASPEQVVGGPAPEHPGSAEEGPGGGSGPTVVPRVAWWLWERVRPLGRPETFVTFAVVTACVVFVFVQFDPSYLFMNTTITGGDTGAHVLLPWVAEHQLLSHFRLTGWTSSNWDGFPAVTFYFPLPIYSIVGLAQIIPYNVAFKLCTAAPIILMPLAAYLMGRLARAPFPVPAVLAVATLPYLFGSEFTIYGGNIYSTLAGEFAFGWSLWFALLFLGLVMRGLQTGRYRAWAAVLFACTFMSHIDPTMFAAMGAMVIIVLYAVRNQDWRGALWWSVPSIAVGGLLAAWWALPFEVRFPYVTNMGYTRNTDFLSGLFPQSSPNDTWLFVLAGMGAVLCLARRNRMGEFFTIVAVLSAIAFRFMPQSILWNNRVLPFWFLSLYLLAGLALAELYGLVVERTTNFVVTLRAALLPGPLVVLLVGLIWVGLPLHILPGEHENSAGDYTFLGLKSANASNVPGWIAWNYTGYQYSCATAGAGCQAGDVKTRWPEYEKIVHQLEAMSKKYGCGNVMWEYQSQMNDYGTTDALTILPYWTNGCIGSMEGLYYEASATTPFHFIDQSELSLAPSDPMVGIPYSSGPDVQLGVEHLQMLGVKYYMALNTEVQQQANLDPSLKLIDRFGPFAVNYSGDTSGPTGVQEQYWDLYLVKGAPRVHPLANQPVVMKGLNNSSQPKYLQVMTGTTSSTGALTSSQTGWYLNPSDWDVYLAATGPSNWKRVPYDDLTDLPVTPEPKTTVSDVVEHNASISFNVSRVGVPIVVTISYFPNWKVSGAKGIYRVSPNLMVVVPTSHHVEMWYGYTPVDYEGWGLSILALVGLVLLARRPQAPVAAVRTAGLGQPTDLDLWATAWGRRAVEMWNRARPGRGAVHPDGEQGAGPPGRPPATSYRSRYTPPAGLPGNGHALGDEGDHHNEANGYDGGDDHDEAMGDGEGKADSQGNDHAFAGDEGGPRHFYRHGGPVTGP